MDSRVCMNGLCGAASSGEWKKGWPLRSGDFANLCDNCGSAYERMVFCDTFHPKDTGWRECTSCGKRLHCGCIASSSLIEMLDGGGVKCIGCSKSLTPHLKSNIEKPKRVSISMTNGNGETRLISVDNDGDGVHVDEMNVEQLDNPVEHSDQKDLRPCYEDDASGGEMKDKEILPSLGEIGTMSSSNFNQASVGSSESSKGNMYKAVGIKDVNETLAQTNLTIALASPPGNPPFPGAVVEDLSKVFSSFQQVSKARHLLPKPPKSILASGLETNVGIVPQIRVARPPAEGRVKNQLLPRYWPRITDQELRQISGDSKSTIVPLFEKVLSASDAGRIGRLVLPKACAEAYFPPISQPEGLPLRIQDVKGKEWVFQFRFWPNNNSRMYVLEGVTPCIQSMQLQAGDTVTFSRMDPEAKLLMGFRKALNTITTQNSPVMSGYSGLLQSLKGSTDPHLTAASKQFNSSAGDFGWHAKEKIGNDKQDGFMPHLMPVAERKRSRNIGLKSKRLLIDTQDALELKLTWEEAQDMLRPPLSEKPSVITIEDHDFEEYEEPPVFGKRSIFTARPSGEQEQWTPCDNCSKWRRLPADILLPPKWTCMDNIWDQSRCSCSAPDELNPRELEILLRLNKDFKKRRMLTDEHRLAQEHDSAGPDTLANAAMLGDGAASVATTTKHPRHRPGCSCIVCIQPPSGKGKHKPTCTCNVCMTVKRRFKTLMMRKKKRQSEKEAEIAQRNKYIWGTKDEAEVDSTTNQGTYHLKNKNLLVSEFAKLPESGKGKLDLNFDPDREEHLYRHQGSSCLSMMSLVQVASLPLETYLKQNGLTSLVSEQQGSSGSHSLPQATGEQGQEQESRGDEPDQNSNDPS